MNLYDDLFSDNEVDESTVDIVGSLDPESSAAEDEARLVLAGPQKDEAADRLFAEQMAQMREFVPGISEPQGSMEALAHKIGTAENTAVMIAEMRELLEGAAAKRVADAAPIEVDEEPSVYDTMPRSEFNALLKWVAAGNSEASFKIERARNR